MHPTEAHPVRQNIRKNILKVTLLLMFPLMFFVRPWALPKDTIYVDVLEIIGAFMVIGCVLGRFWAILYIGDKKNSQVVRSGPYSLCRHPLYLFSTMAAVGLGLMLGIVSLAAVLGLLVLAVLSMTARKEENFLRTQFGESYDSYMAEVPMILPSFRNFQTPERVEFSAQALQANARDALGFLAIFPLVKIIVGVQAYFGLPFLPLP